MNVLIWRLPRGESVVSPGSRCVSCGSPIRFYDNIPVASWLILKGRCRSCRSGVSIMYPLTELLTGFLFWYSYIRFGLSAEFILAVLLIFTAVTAGFADLFTALDTENFECGIIPDSLIVFGLGAGYASSYFVNGDVFTAVRGGALGFLALYIPSVLYSLIRKKEGMGFGDVKLMAVLGVFLGAKSVYFLVFGSAFLGAAAGITWQMVTGRKNIMIPYGPFISAAAIIYLFFETPLDRLLYGI